MNACSAQAEGPIGPFSGLSCEVTYRGGHTQLAAVKATRGLRRIPLQFGQTPSASFKNMRVDSYLLLTSTFPAAAPPLNLKAMAGCHPSGRGGESSSCEELEGEACPRGAAPSSPASSRVAGACVLFCLHPSAKDTPTTQTKTTSMGASERRTSTSQRQGGTRSEHTSSPMEALGPQICPSHPWSLRRNASRMCATCSGARGPCSKALTLCWRFSSRVVPTRHVVTPGT